MSSEPLKDGGRAFPSTLAMGHHRQFGMSLRDWFAGMALPQMSNWPPTEAAVKSYEYADAMLKKRGE